MHLKSMTLRGFKSFASATTLRFEPGITCVVGPNGSGKSNVVDALAWVMGEQGAKSLRGGKMEDVIFAGTSGRAPLGRAEVALTIDNTDGALPIEYSEVTISRTMFRNGGSEYAINGCTCRLLDIQELLSDSGIGREMHVIVGQGQLDSVLHADPMGRRAFIEEAAGVLKHRKRKEKALRKLDAMQANMTRVQDLVGELRRQLKPLGRQAQIARRAATIQADLRDSRLRLLADDLVTLRRAVEQEVADEMALRLRRGGVEQEAEECRRREAVLEAQAAQLGPRVEQAQQTWYRAVGAGRTGARDHRPGRGPAPARHRAADRGASRTRSGGAGARGRAGPGGGGGAGRGAGGGAVLAGRDRGAAGRAGAAAPAGGAAAAGGGAGAGRPPRGPGQAAGQGRGGPLAGGRRGRSGDRPPGRGQDAATARAELATEEYEQLKAQVDGLDAGDAEAEQQLTEVRAALAEAEEAQSRAREELAAVERERAGLTARRDALALGLRRKDGSGALLGGSVSGVLGPAAELLTVRQGAEAAVAAALGHAADAVAVTGVAEAAIGGAAAAAQGRRRTRGAADRRRPGRRGRPRSALPEGAVRAVDLVSGPAGLLAAAAGLLRDTVVVDTLADAEALVAARPELTAVTADGDLLGSGFGYGGSAGAPSLLETQAAVDEAGAALEALAGRREALASGLEQATARRKALAAEVEALAARAPRRRQGRPLPPPSPSSSAGSAARRAARPARPSG